MNEQNINLFEYKYNIKTTTAKLAESYKDKLEPGEEDKETDVSIAGYIMMRHVFSKLAFITV